MQFETNENGVFQINLGNEYYNIIQPTSVSGNISFPKIRDFDPNQPSKNTIFEYLHTDRNLSLGDLESAVHSRLYGMNKFIAIGESSSPVTNSIILVNVVIWYC